MCTPGPAPCAGGPIELVPHDSIGDHFMAIPRDANNVWGPNLGRKWNIQLTQTSSCCGICTPKYMAKGRGESLVFEVQKLWPQRLWKAMFGGVEGAGVRVEGAGGRGSISKLGQSE